MSKIFEHQIRLKLEKFTVISQVLSNKIVKMQSIWAAFKGMP